MRTLLGYKPVSADTFLKRDDKARLLSHVKSLTAYILSKPSLGVELFGDTDEQIDERWDILTQFIKRTIMKPTHEEPAKNKPITKEAKEGEELAEACLHLVIALCNVLVDDVSEIMANEEDPNSYLSILIHYLRLGCYDSSAETDDVAHHSVALHVEALKSLTWLLFFRWDFSILKYLFVSLLAISDISSQTVDFLGACSKYFKRNEEAGEDFSAKDTTLMNGALQCWVFLLSTLDDETIHHLVDYECAYLPPPPSFFKHFFLNLIVSSLTESFLP